MDTAVIVWTIMNTAFALINLYHIEEIEHLFGSYIEANQRRDVPNSDDDVFANMWQDADSIGCPRCGVDHDGECPTME